METPSFSKRAWRETLLRRLLIVVAVIGFVGVTWSLFNVTSTTRWALALTMYPPFAGVALMAARPRWPFWLRAGWLVGAMTLTAAFTYWLAGFGGNAAVAGAASVVMTALLFGRRATMVIVSLLIAIAALTGVAMLTGAWPLPAAENVSPALVAPWVRTTTVAALLWLVLGIAVTHVVAHIEGAVDTEHAARLALHAEQARREQAEAQRHEAERAALQAQKLEVVGQLAAGVAHDFNNVLAVVQGWGALGLGAGASAEDREQAQAAIDAASRQGSALVRQLLAMGRKRQAPARRRFRLADVVDENVRALRRVLPDDLELAVTVENDGVIDGDEAEVQQILFNLVINARDATSGGGTVHVSTGERQIDTPLDTPSGAIAPGRYAFIQVKDTGSGIPLHARARIFEPFFTTKPMGVGTGLGLSTVLGIVRGGGGGVTFESDVGVGTTFTIYLPSADGDAAAPNDIVVRASRTHGGRARVLLLEDNPPMRRLMEALLERDGHEVLAMSDARRALDELDRPGTRFDLLCSDAVMPGVPARDVIDAFERRFPQAPVLLVSGYVQEELTQRGIEEGRYQLLAKPFRPSEFHAAVADLLGRQEPRVKARPSTVTR